MDELNAVQQRPITRETVERWIARGYIQGVTLPDGWEDWPESQITALLTRMFELPTQLDNDSPGLRNG